MKT
ncbi:hypothetical protein CP8484711_1749A, partial [Chlamydia psittaci 84-8471/1]|jgi:hypothetical protein